MMHVCTHVCRRTTCMCKCVQRDQLRFWVFLQALANGKCPFSCLILYYKNVTDMPQTIIFKNFNLLALRNHKKRKKCVSVTRQFFKSRIGENLNSAKNKTKLWFANFNLHQNRLGELLHKGDWHDSSAQHKRCQLKQKMKLWNFFKKGKSSQIVAKDVGCSHSTVSKIWVKHKEMRRM